jgi:predicted ester cyclase
VNLPEEDAMSLEENKVLVQRFIDEVMSSGNTEAINDFCIAGSAFAGGIAGQVKAMKTTFPDLRMSIDTILAEGNKVAARVTTRGTNTGPLVGLPAFGRLETPVAPTGKLVTGTGIYVFTVSDGKIVSFAAEIDQIGLLQQLGWSFTPPA